MNRVFALTGGIASGKSVVTKLYASDGVGIVDADVIAHELVTPGSSLLERLVGVFGAEISHEGALDRKKLGQLAFASREALSRLNAIMVPAIVQRIVEQVGERLQTHPLVCVDAPTLIEHNLQELYRPVVLVVCPPGDQLRRVMDRGFTRDEALARIAAQLPAATKRDVSDYVIDNSSSLETLELLARRNLAALRRRFGV